MKLYLSVVIPCYNEEENLKNGVLAEVYKFLTSKQFPWEVIISDDGSTDKSREIIKDQIKKLPSFKLLSNVHGGKPQALLQGIENASGQYVLFTDMDQSTPISELDKLLPFLKEECVAVIGSRGLIRKNFPAYRRLGAIIFAAIRRTLILPEILDTQCGFKLFEAEALKKAFPKLEFFRSQKRATGWIVTSYDVELLHILKKLGGRIEEVPVNWNDKDVSKSKGSGLSRYIRESGEMFGQILRVKLNDVRGLYNK